VQAIAAWLVARPQNAILGLAVTLKLPFAYILSGAVMVFLVLYQGAARSMLQAILAAALLGAIALVINAPAAQVLLEGLITWMPLLLMASLMRHWRSVNLALQVSVIAAASLMIVFFVAVPDPTEFWKTALTAWSEIFAQMGLQEQADVFLTQQDLIAPQMTIIVSFTSWSLVVGVTMLGYALLQLLPGQGTQFGRFRDFSFGRVLAIVMAVVSLSAVVSGAEWIQNVALLMFAVFWLQGLAIAHWLYAAGRIPGFSLALVYALLPVLNFLAIVGLAITGYTDAWFEFRKRIAVKN
jgi:hypothetical protein